MKAGGPPLRETHETHVSTEQPTTQAHARIPGSHEQPGRPSGAEAAPRQGAQAPHRHDPTEATPLTRRRGDQRLPTAKRIRKRHEFLRLQRVGRRHAGQRFVVITERRSNGLSRIGITVSRRVGGAVQRNRVKRLVREFFRRHQQQLPPQDVLVIARPAAATISYVQVKDELGSALKIDVER